MQDNKRYQAGRNGVVRSMEADIELARYLYALPEIISRLGFAAHERLKA